MVSSVYIHIPFCKKICSYCAFCKMLYNDEFVDKYLDSIKKEIKRNYKKEKLKTLYIGGGTPSSLKINHLEKLFEIIKIFNFDKTYEFTFECNINDITKDLIIFLKNNKVNRLSIGIESFNKKFDKFLNRVSDYEDVKSKIEMIKNIGIENINLDLMYALPGETISDLKKDLKLFLSLNIPHISTYSLMIEENTVLYNNKVLNISEDLDAKMYDLIINTLNSNNYNHYEISNFSKNGFESKHNLVYWNNEMYYGFGLSASGYVNNYRYTNTYNYSKYINGKYIFEKEKILKKDKMIYEAILGFRKTKGINVKEFNKKYKKDFFKVFSEVSELLDSKYLIYENNFIFVNPDKLYVENEILQKLV